MLSPLGTPPTSQSQVPPIAQTTVPVVPSDGHSIPQTSLPPQLPQRIFPPTIVSKFDLAASKVPAAHGPKSMLY